MKKLFSFCSRAIALLVLMHLSSCTDRNPEVQPDVAVNPVLNGLMPKVSEGRLVFNSNQQFKAYMEVIAQKPLEEVNKMNEEIGFSSFLDEPDNASARMSGESDEDQDAFSVIPDPYFASVLNSNLEMELGHNNIFHIEKDGYCVIYIKGKEDEMRKFVQDYKAGKYKFSSDKTKGIKVSKSLVAFKTDVKSFQTKESGSKNGRIGNIGNPNAIVLQHPDGTNNRHSLCQAWDASWIVYASSGCHTRFRFHHWWGWSAENADNLSVSWNNVDAYVDVDISVIDPLTGQYTTHPHVSTSTTVSGTQSETGNSLAIHYFDRFYGPFTYQCDGSFCLFYPELGSGAPIIHINAVTTNHVSTGRGATSNGGPYYWN